MGESVCRGVFVTKKTILLRKISANDISLIKNGFLTTYGRRCDAPVYLYRKQNEKTFLIMKTKSLFIAVVAMVISLAAFGKEEPSNSKGLAVVPVKGSEVIKVIYKGEAAGKVKLNIYNEESQLVFSESISGLDGFIRPLNFNGLKAGQYTVELIDATGKKIEKVDYKPAVSKKFVHISKLSEEGKYLVAVSGNGKETVDVKIYDANNNLLHSELKSIDGSYAQVYTVKNLNGKVTFQVTDAAGTSKTVRF